MTVPSVKRTLRQSLCHSIDRRANLDFSTLQQVNACFVSEEFARGEADVIWKPSFRGRTIYLFVVIEFQYSVDPWVALGFLRYLAEFCQSLVAERQKAALPDVLPLPLYAGGPKWSAVKSVEELIRPELPRSFIRQSHGCTFSSDGGYQTTSPGLSAKTPAPDRSAAPGS